ncbi:MAG TPA: bifunctional DNA primase/polymerase [Tepidisphaeraceae bacterium]|jgi:hypothetical protein|nr:bifunctional DNA primase/polymerase [Tepidisphaeraceae bacterium]
MTSQKSSSKKLKNILAFAKFGIPILPLAPGGAEPAVPGGAKAAVTDLKTLRKLYRRHPDYNYGVVAEGGTFVVSAKGKNAKARLYALASQYGTPLPKTVTFRGAGIRYYVFRAAGMQVCNSQGKLGKGIDVFGSGAYVLGPGSVSPAGKKYCFAKDRGVSDVKIAKGPAWLSDMIGVALAPARSNTYPAGSRAVISLPISAIFVAPKHHVDPEDVDLLDGSIGVLGLRTPITVRPRNRSGNPENSPTFDVVTGHARLAAVRKRGRDRIDAFVDTGEEIDARLWGIAEDIDRRVPSVIEVAEKSAEFDRLLRDKLEQGVQVAPPGGQQPHDKGIRKAAIRLGISREKMRRRHLISGLSVEAKADAEALGLHDNLRISLMVSGDFT